MLKDEEEGRDVMPDRIILIIFGIQDLKAVINKNL